jgi:hypothetical protein
MPAQVHKCVNCARRHMTKNYLRIPCPCSKCRGGERDYRTVRLHRSLMLADQPIFPHAAPQHPPQVAAQVQHLPVAVQLPNNDNDMDMVDIPLAAPEPEQFVSLAETLPSCYKPVYDTVDATLYSALFKK